MALARMSFAPGFALWKGRGRVWVEEVSFDKGSAWVRFDGGTGVRSPRKSASLSDLDFAREWKEMKR